MNGVFQEKIKLREWPYSKSNPSQVIFRLKVSGLPGIMLHVPRALLGCFRGE